MVSHVPSTHLGIYTNIAKGTTDPGVDCFDQINILKNHATYTLNVWFGMFGLIRLIMRRINEVKISTFYYEERA